MTYREAFQKAAAKAKWEPGNVEELLSRAENRLGKSALERELVVLSGATDLQVIDELASVFAWIKNTTPHCYQDLIDAVDAKIAENN
jgi:hypothetical protein